MFKHIVGAFLSLIVFLVSINLLVSGEFAHRVPLTVLASAELRGSEPALMAYAEENRIDLKVMYVDAPRMRLALKMGVYTDAVWPASSLWISRSDLLHVTPTRQDTVGFAVLRPIAERLGWTGRNDLTVQDIRQAAQEGAFALTFPSASQTSIGGLAYLGLMRAEWESGLDEVALAAPGLRDSMAALLAQVDHAPGVSDWLNLPAATGRVEAIFASAMQVETFNARSEVPLEFFAVIDTVADAPFALVPGHAAEQKAAFFTLRDFLATETPADPVDLPPLDVALEAIDLYQTTLRKPSLTVWLLDTSKEMEGAPIADTKAALAKMQDPDELAAMDQQAHPQDVTIVIPYGENIGDPLTLTGNDPTAQARARRFIEDIKPVGGNRDLWYALYEGFEAMGPYQQGHALTSHLPALIALTGGESLPDTREALMAHIAQTPLAAQVPVQGIWLADSPPADLTEIVTLTGGQLVDGSDPATLMTVFRSARAGN